VLDQAKRMKMKGGRRRIWITGRIRNTVKSTLQVTQSTLGLLAAHCEAVLEPTVRQDENTLVLVMIYRCSLGLWCRQEA
ncbi:hypothetical protein K443DRAFT_93268, partial [Laccaria amethystina LaAM-08-1]